MKDNETAAKKTEETLDDPVMEGANDEVRGDEDPRKGLTDPALIRHPDTEKKSANPFG